jgi:hypothetical protein
MAFQLSTPVSTTLHIFTHQPPQNEQKLIKNAQYYNLSLVRFLFTKDNSMQFKVNNDTGA